jgi:hypothetical protein
MTVAEPYVKAFDMPKRRYYDFGRERVDGIVTNYTSSDHSLVDTRSLVGTKNPRWREQIKRNIQAGTTMSATIRRYDLKAHSAEEIWIHDWKGEPKGSYPSVDYYFGDKFQQIPWAGSHDPALLAKANNHALTNFISEANDARQVLQSGELIGEFTELVRQVKSPGKSLRNGLNAYIRSIRNRAMKSRRLLWRQPRHRRADVLTKMVTDTWLEWKFGHAPLISELDDVIQYIIDEDSFNRRDIQAIQGVGIAEDSFWDPNSGSSMSQRTFSSPGFKSRSRVISKATVIYRGQVRMSASESGYIAEKVGFAPDQWLPTLWELVPYSFLADYFANIGDIIYALSFPRSLLPWIMKTTVEETTTSFCDQQPVWKTAADTFENSRTKAVIVKRVNSMGSASTYVKRVEREPFYGSLVPDLEFSIPGTATKWLNMAALFAGGRSVQKLLRRLND